MSIVLSFLLVCLSSLLYVDTKHTSICVLFIFFRFAMKSASKTLPIKSAVMPVLTVTVWLMA